MPSKVDEAIRDIAESVEGASENKVIVALLDLGLILYQKLPANMRTGLWKRNQTFAQQQRLRLKVEQRAQKLADSSRMNAFIVSEFQLRRSVCSDREPKTRS